MSPATDEEPAQEPNGVADDDSSSECSNNPQALEVAADVHQSGEAVLAVATQERGVASNRAMITPPAVEGEGSST